MSKENLYILLVFLSVLLALVWSIFNAYVITRINPEPVP